MSNTPPAIPESEVLEHLTYHDVLISTFVYPGVGQWMQGRKTVATTFIVTITIAFLSICWLGMRPLFVNVAVLLGLGGKTVNDIMDTNDIIAAFTTDRAVKLYILFGGLYFLNVVDVWWAYRKRNHSRALSKP